MRTLAHRKNELQRVFEYDWEYAAPKEKPDIVEWMFILSVFAVTLLVIYLYKKR